jgi:hypothetical protein
MDEISEVKSLLKSYDFNLQYARLLVRDLSEEQMYHGLGPGLENYPAFTLGHLVIASALIAEDLGEPYSVPDGWDDYFRRKGPGDPRLPTSHKQGMPRKDELLSEFEGKHALVDRIVREISRESFERPIEWRFDNYFPTIGDYLSFMCITHEAMHLGQLAAWRRGTGLPSALAGL